MGHFDQFPAISPRVGYLFGQETVAGTTPTSEVRRKRTLPLGGRAGSELDRKRRLATTQRSTLDFS